MAAYVAIGVYLCAVIIVGFVGNVLVIVAFCKFKKLRTANNCLIMNLSVSDLAMAVVGTPMSCSSSFAGRWLYGQGGCSYYGFINYYCGCISLNTFAAISVYRYIVIMRYGPNRRFTVTMILKVIAAVHVITLICTTPPLYGWNEFILEGFKTQCDINYRDKSPLFVSYIAFMFLALFFAPLGIIVNCYWRIFTFLHRRTQEHISQSVSLQLRNSARTMEKRTTIMMLVCLSFFLLAWTPYCFVSLWSLFGDHRDITPPVSAAPALVAKSCIVFNPIIYGVMSPQYRRSFQDTCGKWRLLCKQTGSPSVVTIGSRGGNQARDNVIMPNCPTASKNNL
ncbi:rhodopsin-like [Patiria miniata]|uniref:G-protein coupled receptors family 1 profile domain-containing protein n=1 Tax=Patiria miniata TaxID=46514 RepID=A0A914A9W0_PATMI|nr:rhodopsin-like [Patiria miniata]